jgi:hypothetical protein
VPANRKGLGESSAVLSPSLTYDLRLALRRAIDAKRRELVGAHDSCGFGSEWGYVTHGCRCSICCKAASAARRDRRARARERARNA